MVFGWAWALREMKGRAAAPAAPAAASFRKLRRVGLEGVGCAMHFPLYVTWMAVGPCGVILRSGWCLGKGGLPVGAVLRLVQLVLFLELRRQVGLGQVAEVLVGERVELVLEPAGQHPLDLLLPGLLLEPAVLEELLGAADVLVVELDADIAGEAVVLGIGAGQADELGLGDGHALALEGQVDGALLDDGVDVVAPGVVVDEDVDGDLVLLVQAARQAADAAGRLAVAGEEDAVVAAPELVLGEAVPLGAFLDEEDEVRGAAAD